MRIEHLFYKVLISQPRAFDIIKNLWYNIKKRVFARSKAGWKEKNRTFVLCADLISAKSNDKTTKYFCRDITYVAFCPIMSYFVATRHKFCRIMAQIK